MSGIGDLVVLAPPDTHDLRRRVLRGGRADAVVQWPGDDDTDTQHLGIVAGDQVLAVSTWLVSTTDSDGTPQAIQLRGMATDPLVAGTGLGRRLLRAGIERATEHGAELVWAHARIGAVGFYEHAGFTPTGDPFLIPEIALVHRRVEIALSAPPS